jgi:hypothetical protein
MALGVMASRTDGLEMDELSPAAAGTYWTSAARAIRTDAITRPAPTDITAVADSIRIISVLICSAVIDPLP